MAATLISNIKTLWQTDDGTRVVLRGKEMATIPHLNNAWLLIENGLIADFGTMDTIPELNCTQIDATGKMVLQQQISVASKPLDQTIQTDPRWSKGMYFIKLSNSKNEKVFADSFIVQ